MDNKDLAKKFGEHIKELDELLKDPEIDSDSRYQIVDTIALFTWIKKEYSNRESIKDLFARVDKMAETRQK